MGRTKVPVGRKIVEFGEDGPELGFFPLQRDAAGKLGIRASGEGGGSSSIRQTTIVQNIQTRDPNEFRKSQAQLIADARRSARLR